MRIIALAPAHAEAAVAVINAAAAWYASFLPPDEWQPPEMTTAQWHSEARRMRWFGAEEGATLVGVIGLEAKLDAALIRHAYIAPAWQRQGIGRLLLGHTEAQVEHGTRQLIAGTYARNLPAQSLFQRHGYHLAQDSESILRRYYSIPEERLRTSITLIKAL